MDKNSISELPEFVFIEGIATVKVGPDALDLFLKHEKREILAIQKREGYTKVFLVIS